MNSPRDAGSPAPPLSARRVFLGQAAVGATALLCLRGETAPIPAAAAPASAAPGPPPPAGLADEGGVYLSLGPDEADFLEALVGHMCPADELTPDGVECGLAVFIDRELAGAFGRGDRLYLRGPFRPGIAEDGYQLALIPEQFFKAGIRVLDAGCVQRHGAAFARLDASARESALTDIAAGRWDAAGGFSLGSWFNELVYPLFTQACFSDPVYGGNRDKVFWRMLGYPGLPAVHGRDMITYRGRPYPGAHTPRSMQDFA